VIPLGVLTSRSDVFRITEIMGEVRVIECKSEGIHVMLMWLVVEMSPSYVG
jgi:hypothetical protein